MKASVVILPVVPSSVTVNQSRYCSQLYFLNIILKARTASCLHAVVFVHLDARTRHLTNNGECRIYNFSNRCTHRCSPRPLLYDSNNLRRQMPESRTSPPLPAVFTVVVADHAQLVDEYTIWCCSWCVQATRITSRSRCRISQNSLV